MEYMNLKAKSESALHLALRYFSRMQREKLARKHITYYIDQE